MSLTRTKIICTIGSANSKISTLKKLHKSDINVARINMSYATHKSERKVINF